MLYSSSKLSNYKIINIHNCQMWLFVQLCTTNFKLAKIQPLPTQITLTPLPSSRQDYDQTPFKIISFISQQLSSIIKLLQTGGSTYNNLLKKYKLLCISSIQSPQMAYNTVYFCTGSTLHSKTKHNFCIDKTYNLQTKWMIYNTKYHAITKHLYYNTNPRTDPQQHTSMLLCVQFTLFFKYFNKKIQKEQAIQDYSNDDLLFYVMHRRQPFNLVKIICLNAISISYVLMNRSTIAIIYIREYLYHKF
eukprot:TRINITY_DN12005_c0_g1_i2.p1 TRINITY_DN12005_c0_g1~~TRINITY_DN12005_c0_g1_i2.p1  ORF type:complete len:280 (+),score=-32.59 TRINITY_DN12005_c0_g1_i2:102-842(+)